MEQLVWLDFCIPVKINDITMKKHTLLLLLSLAASSITYAQQTVASDSTAKPVQPARVVDSANFDLTFAQVDSIRSHASMLYASQVLNQQGYSLAYGHDLNQREWKKYGLNEVAFAHSARYDERRRAWKTDKKSPFAYIRMVYDGANQRLCHYQVKFATRKGFSQFHKDAVDAGYIYKGKKRDSADNGVESTYYCADKDCYIVFGEYADGQMTVDCWKGGLKIGM